MTSSSSRGAEFYFQCAVMLIGIVGTATNALILYAMVASKQHKKHVLIFNQNVLDLFSSVFTMVTYSVKLCNIHLTGSIGYWLCCVILSDSLVACTMSGSVINLAVITVERYLKVVHSAWSKKKLRKWMTYSVMAFIWIAYIIYNQILVFSTSVVIDGACYAYVIWVNETLRMIQVFSSFVTFYVVVLLIFIFCYWRILAVIRRQASVMAGHSAAGSSAAQTLQSNQIQLNVIKTMILVSAFYAISWLPHYICVLLLHLNPNPTLYSVYHVTVVIIFLYICTNPFIYAIKFDPVKKILLDKFSCKKISQQAAETVANS